MFKKIFCSVVTIVMTILTAALVTGCGGKTVDLQKALSVSYKGLDGYAHLEEKVNSAAAYKENRKINTEEQAKIDGFWKDVTFVFSEKESLNTGNVINVVAKYDEQKANDCNFKIKNDKFELTVPELKKGTIKDIFEGVEVVGRGIAPEGAAVVVKNKEDDFLNCVDYAINNNENLKNGSKVSVVATYSPEYAIEKGYIITSTEKWFEVNGFDEYITDAAKVTPVIIETLKSTADKQVEKNFDPSFVYPSSNDKEFIIRELIMDRIDPYVFETTFNKINGEATHKYSFNKAYFCSYDGGIYNNLIYMIYDVEMTADITGKGLTTAKGFAGVMIGNPAVAPDGKLMDYDISENDKVQLYHTIDEALLQYRFLYEISEIK